MLLITIVITCWSPIVPVSGEIIIERNVISPDRIRTETEKEESLFYSTSFYKEKDKSGYRKCKDLRQGYGRYTVASLTTGDYGTGCFNENEIKGGKSHFLF